MKAALVALLAAAPVAADPLREPHRPPRVVPLRTSQEEAQQLAAELRKPTDPSSPLDYIQLDIDVVESGAPHMRMTRKQVAGLARTWGRLLADPARRDVACGARKDGVLCFQAMNAKGPEIFMMFCRRGGRPLLLEKIAVVTSRGDIQTDFFREPCAR